MELVGNAWQSFMDAPDYSEYSPWFPNPLICLRDIARSGVNEVVDRLPWNGMETWLQETWNGMYHIFYLDLNFVVFSFMVAIMLTLVRFALNFLIFKRIPIWYKLNKESSEKFPESIWKLIIYTITWLWGLNLIVKEDYFFDLKSHWNAWSPGVPVDSTLKSLYIFETGFYLHCIYATLYLETIRKDFHVMMTHHFLTIVLLVLSYAIRVPQIGLLVLFLHDIGDIWLELSKTVFYFKIRGGKEHWGPELIATFTFVIFTVQHILFRLYWLPMKACYSAMHVSMVVLPGLPYWGFIVILWAVYAMQVYWFKFILELLWKILIKGEKKDTRDYNEDGSTKTEQQQERNGVVHCPQERNGVVHCPQERNGVVHCPQKRNGVMEDDERLRRRQRLA